MNHMNEDIRKRLRERIEAPEDEPFEATRNFLLTYVDDRESEPGSLLSAGGWTHFGSRNSGIVSVAPDLGAITNRGEK